MAETKAAAARRINDTIRYMQISVFAVTEQLGTRRQELVEEVQRELDAVKGDLVTRGWYDVGGLRADADLMVWWHSDESETLQAAYHAVRATSLGQRLKPAGHGLQGLRPSDLAAVGCDCRIVRHVLRLEGRD